MAAEIIFRPQVKIFMIEEHSKDLVIYLGFSPFQRQWKTVLVKVNQLFLDLEALRVFCVGYF